MLPPVSVACPTSVVHFVGGTFFGSAPALWYNNFLEELVKNTQMAVVATSIPVTVFQSPLEHVALAKKLDRQFQVAWRDVLVDEYGDKMADVAVCGLGHSLGSRLLVVLATLGTRSGERRRRSYPPPPDFKALVVLSFTNYGAAAGIPGIYQLNRASRQLRRETMQNRESLDEKRRRKSDYLYGDDFEDEEDWGEVLSDLGDVLQQQASKLKSALTPSEDSLEFYPSPDQLWKALTMDGRYNISNTLIVQFDDDKVDQSSKLASALAEASSVYFSRIRGTHLTPVAPSNRKESDSWLERFNSRLGKSLARLLTGRRRSRINDESLLQLRQVVSSYLIEIISKDRAL